MNDLTIINATPTMTSREIADMTGKDHFNVLADIRKMLDELEVDPLSFQGVYLAGNGEQRPLFNLPKRECLILISGYSVTMRARIVDRWQELEAGKPALEYDLPTALRLYADEVERRSQAERQVVEMRPKAILALARIR